MFVRKLFGLNSVTKELDFSRRFAAFASAQRRAPLIIDEPEYPLVKTPIPGPVSRKLQSELDKIQFTEGTSVQKAAAHLHIDQTAIQRILEERGLKAHYPRLVHGFLEDDYDCRMVFCEKELLKLDFQPDLEDKVLWSVESVFHLDGHVNRHNGIYWALANPHKQIEMSLKSPKLCVWEGYGPMNATGVCYFVNPEKCAGNYVVDADGNTILDAYMMVASLPLGYNHPDLIETCRQPHSLSIAVSRPALGFYPTIDYVGHLENALLSVAPKGHRQVQTMMCGATANENALKVAMIKYQTRKRGGSPTDAELRAAMLNQPPGCPNLSVLSFENAFHGRMFACLSASRSKAIHKVDLPAFDWPMAPFPRYQDPVDSNSERNRVEDERCLAEVERLIQEWAKKDKPVVAVIVEPIQAEGGDNYGSTDFFRKLQALVKKHGCAFIVDEVQTGCGATGRMWAHEEWNLERPPDMVTFSKKMLLGGFYYTDEYRVEEPYRIFNTWMGDPMKLALLETVIKTIKRDNLLELNRESGKVLLGGLKDLEQKFPRAISKSRGKGTFVAFDLNSADARKSLLDELLKKGIQLGYCGEKTVRFRPALIFQPMHAKLCLEKIEDVLQEMNF